MSQTNEIHPQLGAPPPPMTEEGTTGTPAPDDRISDQVGPADDTPIYDGLATAGDADGGDDAPGTVTIGDASDQYAEDPTPPDVPVAVRDDGSAETGGSDAGHTSDTASTDDAVRDTAYAVPADDGSAAEDADVETSTDEPAPVVPDEPAPETPTEPSPVSEEPAVAAAPGLDDDYSIGHVFDQTNGVIEGLDGESDGTAAGEERSDADQHGQNQPNPVGQQDAFRDDHYGADDGRDPNP